MGEREGGEGGPRPRAGAAATWQRRLLGGGLLVAGVLLIDALIAVWPAVNAPAGEARSVPFPFGFAEFNMVQNTALLLLVVIAAGLGATVNTTTEFAYRVGDNRLDRSYLWWYPMRYVIAATLALVFYFVVRGGLLNTTASASDELNVYVLAGLSGLAGLFSTQVTRLLGRVFGAVPGAEEVYAQPAPKVDQLVRGEDDEKGSPGELVLQGHGFAARPTVMVDGEQQKARLIDDTRIGLRLDPKFQPGQKVGVVVVEPSASDGTNSTSEVTKVMEIPDPSEDRANPKQPGK
jgi:hypothetical protein